MKSFWDGLAGIAKVMIIAVTCIIIAFVLSTCTMFGALVAVPA